MSVSWDIGGGQKFKCLSSKRSIIKKLGFQGPWSPLILAVDLRHTLEEFGYGQTHPHLLWLVV